MEITPLEFKEWTQAKITKEVVKQVVEIRESLKNTLASGYTLANDADVTTDRLVGRIEGITELFNLFNDVKEGSKEDYDH